MRARIYQWCRSSMWYGQIYDEKNKCWKDVTPPCNTKWGAKREIKKWREMNLPKEFEI